MLVRLTKIIFIILQVLVYAWAILVLLFSPALASQWRIPAATAFISSIAVALFWRKRTALMRRVPLFLLGIVALLWTGLSPSNDRVWTPDSAAPPWAEIKGDEVTLHNIRYFNYRSEDDFDLNYYSKSVKLSEISEGDIIASYWAGKSVAHIMVSFGFNNKEFLAFSIETRKEQGEGYSALNGFFRNYELMYVVADERDVLRVRTNYRNPPEKVYVLRTDIPLENARKLFMQYVQTINTLRDKPEFYNSLTTNCTTRVLAHTQTYANRARYNWKIFLSGYVPDYLFELGALAPGFEFEEIMRRSMINERSIAAGVADDYSIRIRDGIPKPQPKTLPH